MTPGTSGRRSPLVTGIGALAVLSALTFLLAASMHLGVRIPLILRTRPITRDAFASED